MASQRKILRTWNDIALIREDIYLFVPYLTIETAYVVTSRRKREGAYFENLTAATNAFAAEIGRSGAKLVGRPAEPAIPVDYRFISSHLT